MQQLSQPFCRHLPLVLACGGLLWLGCSDDAAQVTDGGGNGGVGAGDTTGTGAGGSDVPDLVDQIDGVSVATIAGSADPGDSDTPPGSFNNPANLAVNSDGTVIIADFDNGMLRTLSADGTPGTLTNQVGFRRPFGLALTDDGKVVAQTDWNATGDNGGATGGVLWLVDPMTGAAEVLAPDVGRPRGLARVDASRLVVSDIERHDVRLFDLSTSAMTPLAGKTGEKGYVDGAGEEARFDRPYGSVRLPSGDVAIADQGNHVIRLVSLDGSVSTLAGTGKAGMVDGPIADARFNLPQDLAVDAAGNLYVSDVGNHRIRRISADGRVQTVAGNGTAGFQDGPGGEAEFFGQEGIDLSPDGKTLYVADGTNGEVEPYHRIRAIALP